MLEILGLVINKENEKLELVYRRNKASLLYEIIYFS